MSTKYHYNPETGEVGACRALIKCRFLGPDDHLESEADARTAFERTMEGETFSKRPARATTLSYRRLKRGGAYQNVGELLANVTPGHEIVIRRFVGVDDEGKLTEESLSLSKGESGNRAGEYWDHGKAAGVFVFPLALFNKELTLEQAALQTTMLLQEEMDMYHSSGAFVVMEVPRAELKRSPMPCNYEVFQDEEFFAEINAVNPGMAHGFNPKVYDRLYVGDEEEGKLMNLPEYTWNLNSSAAKVHGFFGSDVKPILVEAGAWG